MPTKIEISTKTLLTILGIVIGSYLLYLLRSLVMELLVSAIIMVAVNPTVSRLQGFKVGSYSPNRASAVTLAYLFYILIVSFFISIVARPLASETASLISQL